MKWSAFLKDWNFKRAGEESYRKVQLPHDAGLEEPRSAEGEGQSGQAYFSGGSYVYEKKFEAPLQWADRTVAFAFDGVYRNCRILLNGEEIGGRPYGYIPFVAYAGESLHPGEENTLTVLVDNSEMPNSRWYSGAGIYRPVHLLLGGKDYIKPYGVRITTLSAAPAAIRVDTDCTGGDVSVSIFDGDEEVASGEGTSVILGIDEAKLWSAESPHLYTCRVKLSVDGYVKDEAIERFGIREIKWGKDGLFVNGVKTLLRGGCIHHDHGVLGAAAYPKSDYRRAKILKEAGFNAVRMAHNPASTAFLRACDELGLYVMDEGWDMWFNHKTANDYASLYMENYVEDLETIVARDYNHPSVTLYSIGNEVSEPANDRGLGLMRDLVFRLHELDPSRPVTAGINLAILLGAAKGNFAFDPNGGGLTAETKEQPEAPAEMNSTVYNKMVSAIGTGMNNAANSKEADAVTSPALDLLDIAGYNYASGRYPLEREAHPDRVVVGSETFPQDIWKNWEMVEKYPYLVGDFMWTAWDYLGEAGIGAWSYSPDGMGFSKPYPWLLADVGVFDILGDPCGELYLAQAAWGQLKEPGIAVRPVNHPGETPSKSTWRGTNSIPSWSWQGCEGNPATVEVYYPGDEAELFINGKSQGKKKIKDGVATFKVKYRPGEISAVIYGEDGKEICEGRLRSAVGRSRIVLTPEESTVKPGEIFYCPVLIAGGNGIVESNDDRTVSISVEGGTLLGFGSANPRTEESFLTGTYTTYYGRALAVVRAGDGETVTITASEGKQRYFATVKVER